MTVPAYPIEVRALPPFDGGGFIARVPALPGCMSDGATEVEARENVLDAIESWIATAKRYGKPIPSPRVNA